MYFKYIFKCNRLNLHFFADPCFVQRNEFTFPMDTNCAGYWSCYKGRSEAQCCPSNYTYVQNKGCVSDLGCRKPCPSAIVPVKEHNISKSLFHCNWPIVSIGIFYIQMFLFFFFNKMYHVINIPVKVRALQIHLPIQN